MRPPVKVGDYLLERTQFFALPRDEVFPFFADAMNLEKITPAFLNFHILTPPPIEMRPGAQIEYTLRLFGLPMHWRTDITAFDPPFYFADEQARGPYALWYHEHEFHEVPGGTLMIDRVNYSLPYWFLGTIAHRLWVRDTLEEIFNYRKQGLEQLFAGKAERSASGAIAASPPGSGAAL
jgi:ligand-binding SRPBCC domain-containing protein